MSEIRSQATPARDELVHILAGAVLGNPGGIGTLPQHAADRILAAGWSKSRTVKFSELGSLPNGVVVRNNEGGTIAVRESERDWFISGLDYEIELWELENPEGDDFTVLFTPGDAG